MAIALDPDGCFDFVLPRERGNADATTWRLGFLRGRELDAVIARIQDKGQPEIEQHMESLEQVVALAIRGWKDFRDTKGKDFPFPARVPGTVFGCSCEVVAPEAMARLPMSAPDMAEILRAVLDGNQVGAEAAKKSPSPQA